MSGPAAETYYLGELHDGSDAGDLAQAREVLSRKYNAMEIGYWLAHYRAAADRLIRSPFGQTRIPIIATELLRIGTLNAEQIAALI